MSMTVKAGIKDFSERGATPGLKGDPEVRTTSATSQTGNGANPVATKGVDEILNSLTDPNWVDPAKKARAVGNANLDKDAFMKLMLAQMKNQDPTNPMQAHEMASQLASFTSLEQLQNINSTLETMKKAQAPVANFETLNFIGKAVSGDNSKVNRLKGDTSHDFQFNLPTEAKTAEIKIKNSSGEVVRTLKLQDLKAGENKVSWNGQDDAGNSQPADEYQIQLEAQDPSGKKLIAQTEFSGLVTGVNYTAEGPILLVGNRAIKVSDVRKIIDPRLMKNDQNINEVKTSDLKSPEPVVQTKTTGEVAGDPQKTNMGKLAMAREVEHNIKAAKKE